MPPWWHDGRARGRRSSGSDVLAGREVLVTRAQRVGGRPGGRHGDGRGGGGRSGGRPGGGRPAGARRARRGGRRRGGRRRRGGERVRGQRLAGTVALVLAVADVRDVAPRAVAR